MDFIITCETVVFISISAQKLRHFPALLRHEWEGGWRGGDEGEGERGIEGRKGGREGRGWRWGGGREGVVPH